MSGLRPFSTYSSSSGGTDGSDALPDVVAWRACRLAERVFLHAVRLSLFLGGGGDKGSKGMSHFVGEDVAAGAAGGVVG